MKKNILYVIAFLFVLVSCTEEKLEVGSPLTGQDVKFSVSMGNDSRTIYGAEEADGKSIKVNWVNGDKITVFGTTCAVQQADYSVVAEKSGNQNYADDLVKTGAAGVQWGSEPSDFYAIYPAVDEAIEMTNGIVTINTSIRQFQSNDFVFNSTTNTWVGTPYMEGSATNTMPDALMYAMTPGVSSTDNNGVVNLNFKPFSTVLKFTLDGWDVSNEMTEEVGSEAVAYVSKITIKAPCPVTGSCTFTFDAATPTVEGGEFNDIVIYPKSLPLKQGQKVEFSAFAIPRDYTITDKEDDKWIVEVETTNFGSYTFPLKPKKAQDIKKGQLHKLNIPLININKGEVKLPAANWIRYIPRNVYLSELSMPGAWYATNSDYQGSATLTEMYTNGVRAFNIDCRVTATAASFEKQWHGGYTLKSNPTYVLQCAGSETLEGANILGLVYASKVGDGKTVESQLETLSKLVSDSEYIMVVLTVAEKPKDLSGSISGNTESFGNNVDPSKVLAAIKDILARKGKALNVFGYRDIDVDEEGNRKTLNANTTINDVLGSMIVKINVNVDQDNTDLANYAMSNVLLCEGSMASESIYISSPIVAGSFTGMNTAELYWGASKTNPSMIYYYHQAQLTTSSTTQSSSSTIPSLKDRMDAVDDIIAKSASIYEANKHNGLFQLGIGGYINNKGEDRATVANTLNKHVLDQVKNKLNTSPSPVGIVLMNYCTNNTYGSLDLLDAILNMNTKFHLNRNKEDAEWPDGNPYKTEEEENGDF